jgi:peptidoglycan/LPS O-acetylase OafA/YrhL
MQSKNTPYLARLDHLRALAAISVLFFEARLAILSRVTATDGLRIPLIDQGHIGVGLFMVISGFILARIASGGPLIVSRFYLNRIIRIYPLMIVVMMLGYAVIDPPHMSGRGLDFLLALLPISNLYRGFYGAYGGMLWSIAVELQFYLLFPFLWLALARYRVRGYMALIGFLLLIRGLVFLSRGTVQFVAYFTMFGCLDLFIAGCLAHEAYRRWGERVTLPLWVPTVILAFIMLAVGMLFGGSPFFQADSPLWIVWPTLQGAMFGTLLVGYLVARQEIWGSAAFAWIGRISYSVYVWQYLMLTTVMAHLPIAAWMTPYLFGLLVLPCVLVLAGLSYYVIERPILDLRVRYIAPSSPTKGPAAEKDPR